MIDIQVLTDTAKQMKFHTFPSLAGLYGSIDENIGELVGSGTFINFQGQPYLLTAGHVAFEKDRYIGLTHTRSNGFLPSLITNPYHILNKFLDICVVKIEAEELKGTNITPISTDRLALHSNNLDGDILFTHGYPGAKSKSVRLLDAVFSTTQPFGTFTGGSVYPWFDSQYHFALDYPQTGQLDENISEIQLEDPHGLSGSAVWKTNRDQSGVNWSPLQAEIVGVIHHWDDHANSLIATRIEFVRDLLLRSFRRELAYFHWLERGAPTNDDWNDWFVACEKIPSI